LGSTGCLVPSYTPPYLVGELSQGVSPCSRSASQACVLLPVTRGPSAAGITRSLPRTPFLSRAEARLIAFSGFLVLW
jgi:hypothetical protein